MALVENPSSWLITSRVEAREDEKITGGALQKEVY